MKLKKECEDEKSENSREDNCERRSSDLAKSKSLVKNWLRVEVKPEE
jgi:hypothetical protein